MISYANNTLAEYLEKLAAREPVPGGGSAAALTGAMGAALIEMVARYSLGKGKPEGVEQELAAVLEKAGALRLRLLDLATRDSQAFLNMREARKAGEDAYRKACALGADVPREVRDICGQALALTPLLHKEGNMRLISDVVAAELFLKAGAGAAQAMIEANQ